MPVPTADVYDKQNSQSSPTRTTASTNHTSTDTQASGRTGPTSGNMAGTSHQNTENGRALSKEEADRLYEERMEEEYAKREGGA